ncbi:MAG: GyrI-like domain-containing protein [Nocardiaceae bacterium]|nr:GyrI-like domain-containing protein [Nocardiaceae bacterium]
MNTRDADDVQMYSISLRHQYKCLTAVMQANVGADAIGQWLGGAYSRIEGETKKQGARLMGPPFARFHPLADGSIGVEAGFPVDRIVRKADGIRPSTLPETEMITTTHVGPYAEMKPVYDAMGSWLSEHQCEADGDPWEIYFTDPGEVPDAEQWRTAIVQPCRPR